jgi:hypothetical protein
MKEIWTVFDKGVARAFGEKQGRTITEVVEDNFGISQKWFHRFLIFSALVGCLSLGAMAAKAKLDEEIDKGVREII